MSRSEEIVAAARARASRPTPLGGPWWAYALAIGLANGARQLLFPDMATWLQVTTFVLTVTLATAVVALTWRLTHRRDEPGAPGGDDVRGRRSRTGRRARRPDAGRG